LEKQSPLSETTPPVAYAIDLSLDRLKTGVDNIRHDVYFSGDLHKTVQHFIFQIIVKQTQTEDALHSEKETSLSRIREKFRRHYREISLYGINKAKSEREIQIDRLVQVALFKLLLDTLPEQFDHFQARLRETIRGYELSHNRDDAIELDKKIFAVKENRQTVLRLVGRDVFLNLQEINRKDLNELRRINFGDRAVIPDGVFSNPMLFAENPFDDYFTLKHYEIMFGHRPEDPDRYESLLVSIKKFFFEIHGSHHLNLVHPDDGGEYPDFEGWLGKAEHIDFLFNCFQTAYRCRSSRKSGGGEDIRRLKKLSQEQGARLSILFRRFDQDGILKKILAVCEMQPVYLEFCPPLVPQLIAQFLIDRQVRKSVAIRLKQLGRLYGKTFSTKPLHRIRRQIWLTRIKHEYGFLIRFLKNFVKFHGDYRDYTAIRESIDQIHMATDLKIVNLSRVNNTLYEFLLPNERRFQEKPILSHVILKADVRGSTTITHRMMMRDLNPASYFSLNFFDPITEILPDYGAEKVFVEGDAIILSIFEREDDPTGRYSVARACGLAVSILSIVRSCNLRNGKYRLPDIELGIGITYTIGRPAFLFDGDQRIMISSAINIADRMAGCSKLLKQALFKESAPFNLYVFQSMSDKAISEADDDLFLRYNVNGIELSAAGFQKLREEIEIQPFTVAASKANRHSKMKFYTGKFPLVSGEFQRLVIREAPIVRIDPNHYTVKGLTERRYYEICTNIKLRKIVENLGG